MWPTGQPASLTVVCLLALFLQNKHIFIWLLVRQLTGQLLCTIYKSNPAGGLTLYFTLLFPILSDLSACVPLMLIFSVFL